jgi:glycerophosphoryl diester phosphodiesterase
MKQRYQAMLTLLAVACASVSAYGFDFFEPVQPPRAFQVMVHRGMMHQAPENTRPALERVIEDGLEWAEVDVRLTKDHQHVIFHDSSVEKKTDGSGNVRNLTLEEIKRLDAGGWFAPRYAGERVLTLTECLMLAKGRLNLYLDCKEIDPELLAREILEADMARQIVVFDDLETLALIREKSDGRIPLMPKWHTAFGLKAWTEKWRPDAVEINVEEVTQEICRFFHQRHIKVQAKVLGEDDRPEVWDRMLAAGVDWLQTDRPADILAHRLWESLDRRPVEMAIHRGASRYAPENTLAAFKKAVALGADYVEFDIRTSQDGQHFILHDRHLDRTTNGQGLVAGTDAATIADLDAGAWFGRNYQKTPVPRLDDTLDYLNGKAQLYVDAKDIPVEALVEKLRGKGMADKAVVYQSPAYLEKLKDLWPEARGLCPLGNPKQVENLAERLQPYAFDASWAILSRELIDRCHALGIKVFSDGIGDHERVKDYLQAIEWGIDLIQTDHPLRVIRAVEMANMSESSRSLPIGKYRDQLDLSSAVIVTRSGELENAERAAAEVLVEEMEKRTGIHLATTSAWPDNKTVIAIASTREASAWGRALPAGEGGTLPEGYRLLVDRSAAPAPVVWVLGADARGALYGVGALLRNLDWGEGRARIRATLDIATAPAYSIRGHQLGFRTQANSWDAWTPEQFDQYIRELAFFGINSVENIPFHDDRPTPVMKVDRRVMNRMISASCGRYGLDYWVWTPADYDLNDAEARARALDQHEQLYRDCEELTGVFFPGGDPGDNSAQLVIPFLEDIARRLLPLHPEARVWLSLQHFNRQEIEYVIEYLKSESPEWMGGLVAGPSAPPVPFTRRILPEKYQYRLYPDITHNKICQYPVPWWDQALALTLGRESINPRPVHYAYIHNWFAPYSDGFISYSDGVHDDVNKTVWSALGWNPERNIRDILIEYCRLYFGPGIAEAAADGILALEKNWTGSLRENGAVEGTLLHWQQLERKTPHLQDNWRWQMCLVRAYYDAYIRHRLINETHLEEETNAILAQAKHKGSEAAIQEAVAVLNQCVTRPVSPDLRIRIEELCGALFHSCGLQTSVPKYFASGAERGAFLDFVDYPLNNRWWLEDEFQKVRAMASEAEKAKRLYAIAHWEYPGPGSYYDDVGNPAKSPHVKRSPFPFTEPGEEARPEPTLWWWDEGKSRARLSWQVSMNYPEAVVYEGLDPDANYTVCCGGYGKFLLAMDGEDVAAPTRRTEMGDNQDFKVPSKHLQDRKLVLTWKQPTDESHLNWRQHSRLAEVWLLKE